MNTRAVVHIETRVDVGRASHHRGAISDGNSRHFDRDLKVWLRRLFRAGYGYVNQSFTEAMFIAVSSKSSKYIIPEIPARASQGADASRFNRTTPLHSSGTLNLSSRNFAIAAGFRANLVSAPTDYPHFRSAIPMPSLVWSACGHSCSAPWVDSYPQVEATSG